MVAWGPQWFTEVMDATLDLESIWELAMDKER